MEGKIPTRKTNDSMIVVGIAQKPNVQLFTVIPSP